MTDEPAADEAAKQHARKAAEQEYKREWRRRNAERLREYRATFYAEHGDRIRAKNRAYMRRMHARKRAQEERRERRRVYSRKYYAENRESYLDYQRAARARRKAEDPERYLRQARASQQRWREGNREKVNAWQRKRYEADPAAHRERSAKYYADNRERILAKHRRRWADNRDELLAKQREYRARERRRRQAGLPPRRLHRVPIAERRANDQAAEVFFLRTYDLAEIAAERHSLRTSSEELARWERDCARARAVHYRSECCDVRGRFIGGESRGLGSTLPKTEAALARAAEEEHLDAIARVINDRLRQHPRTSQLSDPAGPHQGPSPHGLGLNR